MTPNSIPPQAIPEPECSRRRIFILILDGAADDTRLGDRTPLNQAYTPALDELAMRAAHGLVEVIPGVVPESDCGCMAWLGFDPHIYYTGRGPLEGLGCGFIKPGMNSVCFRFNFANWNPATKQLERRTARGLSQSELDQLVQELRANVLLDSPDLSFELEAFGGYRGVLAFHSRKLKLSGNVSNTDPLFIKKGPFGQQAAAQSLCPAMCVPLDDAIASVTTAKLVNLFSERASLQLQQSPVNQHRRAAGLLPSNYVLLRDGGEAPPKMPTFNERFGLTVEFFGQIPAERGLMDLLGGSYTDARMKEAEKPAEFYHRIREQVCTSKADVVMIHFVKGADEGGHDKDFEAKKEAIEHFDRYFLEQFSQWLSPSEYLVVTSDHATPCSVGLHTADPVPIMIAGPLIKPDGIERFSEVDSRVGLLNLARACDYMPWLRDLAIGNAH